LEVYTEAVPEVPRRANKFSQLSSFLGYRRRSAVDNLKSWIL